MVVLFILLIMALVSVPTLKGYYRKNELKAATRQFVAIARYARQEAILRNSPTELVINFKKDSYYLVLNPMKKSDYRSSREKVVDELQQEHFLATSTQKIFFEKIESATDPHPKQEFVRIRFFPNGSAASSKIIVSSPDKQRMTVEITGATGGIRVTYGTPDQAVTNPPQPGVTP